MFKKYAVLGAWVLVGVHAHASIGQPAVGNAAVTTARIGAETVRSEKLAPAQEGQPMLVARSAWGSLFRAVRDYRNGRG